MATLTAPAYTKAGVKAASAVKLDAAVFGVMPENHNLLKLAYNAYLANGRATSAITKTRGLVSGGGKKPWKQKGTGRARFGSSRNPIWRGGGIAFGPTGEENHHLQLNLKAKRQAVRQALSLAAGEGRIRVLESLESKEGKVSEVVKLLAKVEAKGTVLLVVDHKNDLIERATRNLPNAKVTQATYLNVFDVMNADCIVVGQSALEHVGKWLAVPKKAIPVKEKEGEN